LAQLSNAVEAFEPVPSCANRIRAGALKNVRIHEVALSDRRGHANLNLPPSGGRHAAAYASLSNEFESGRSLTVEVRTLDSFGFTEVEFIKIDVEGHELEVLMGATSTIERNRPTLLVEIEERHRPLGGAAEVFDFIERLGYDGSFLWYDRLTPLSSFSLSQHQASADPHDRTYVNNFIFRPQ
jgi:FkbM family methyltransferase